MQYDLGDTIAAISTPSGIGGIGIVRLSGPEALRIADQMFVARNGVSPTAFLTYTVHYGDIVRRHDHGTEVIDEALLTVMRAPKSYTCEDVVEISCHGGSAAVNVVLELVLGLGARLAGPGEFTKRAFLNGRIDLAQAEAVLDVIKAKTSAGLSVFEHQLKGELTQRLETIRQELMETYVNLEAILNFPDNSSEDDGQADIINDLSRAYQKIQDLLATADQGRILREGIKIVLCGKPNVGKSSLLNALLRQPRAIVSHIAGTTRDSIEESAQIEGVPFQIIDTAGILVPRDEIEEEAVRRSHAHIEEADLVLFLVDASTHLMEEDYQLAIKLKDRDVLIVLNKTDLGTALDQKEINAMIPGKEMISMSVLKNQGIDDLRQKILQHVLHGNRLEAQHIFLSNIRHIDLLRKAAKELYEAHMCSEGRVSLEFIAEHIKHAVQELDRITGRDIDVDLVDKIFEVFCVGK